MISDKAFAQEYAEITPIATESHFLGEDGEESFGDIQESAGAAEASVEDVEDESETIDLNAVLGGGIRKAPAAETEPEPIVAEATA